MQLHKDHTENELIYKTRPGYESRIWCSFSHFLKVRRDGAEVTSTGRSFHMWVSATKAQRFLRLESWSRDSFFKVSIGLSAQRYWYQLPLTLTGTLVHQLDMATDSTYLRSITVIRTWKCTVKICPIRDCRRTPRNSLTLNVKWRLMRKNIKNLSSKNLDNGLEYHNSSSVFWLPAYWRWRQTMNWIFSQLLDLCDRYLGSGHITYCHVALIIPLPTHQFAFKSERLFVDRQIYGHLDRLY